MFIEITINLIYIYICIFVHNTNITLQTKISYLLSDKEVYFENYNPMLIKNVSSSISHKKNYVFPSLREFKKILPNSFMNRFFLLVF